MAMKYAVFAFLFSLTSLFAQEKPKLRLPGDVRPVRYDLVLRLVPAQETYSGRVTIDVEVLKPVRTIWLHSSGIKISWASVGTVAARPEPAEPEFLALVLDSPMNPGRTRIEIEFSRRFNQNDVEGLFRQVEEGEPYVFTQFEPTSARRAFPCFDEPSFKTPWRVTLHVPKDSKAFANTPELSETDGPSGLKTVRFAESKPLPTYLVAMAVGRFDVSEAGKAGRKHIPVRTLVLKGRTAETKFVNSVTPKIIAALEDFFGLPYPYGKLDQITIPVTVAFGAMENAGLITYRQTLLLARAEEVTPLQQRTSASVIAHELAHQWFGNMVTPAWWDDIWLNEAFATWMAGKVMDRLFPEWETPVYAVQNKTHVMGQDALLSARRVRQPIEAPGDIGLAFDGITYQKGAALIRMFEHYLGEERFLRGVQAYIRKHAWGNATASDFLAAISGSAGQNISPAFSQFLDRGGLPVVSVELRCDGKPRVMLTQQRSLPVGSKGNRQEYWSVPVCFRYESGGKVSRECVLLSDPRDEVPLRSATSCPAWLNANDDAAGYYQVQYRGNLTQKLLANQSRLSTAEKADLLRNAAGLVRSGLMAPDEALLLAKQFAGAGEPEVVSAAMSIADSMDRAVPVGLRSNYFSMIREYFGGKARELGWLRKAGEPETLTLLRPRLLLLAGSAGEPEVVSQARRLTDEWLKNRSSLPADLAGIALAVSAQHDGAELHERLVTALKETKSARERDTLIRGIGAFRDPAVARRALGMMLTGEVDIRELTELIPAYQSEPATRDATWAFVTANYDKLLTRLPSRLGVHGGSILPEGGSGFCDEQGYRQVEQFFRDRVPAVSGADRVLARVLERIQLCDARRREQSAALAAWLGRFPAD